MASDRPAMADRQPVAFSRYGEGGNCSPSLDLEKATVVTFSNFGESGYCCLL